MGFAAIVILISHTRQLRNRETKRLTRLFGDDEYVDADKHCYLCPQNVCVCLFYFIF